MLKQYALQSVSNLMIWLQSKARKSNFAELIERPDEWRVRLCATGNKIVCSDNSEENIAVSEWSVSVNSRESTRYYRGAEIEGD